MEHGQLIEQFAPIIASNSARAKNFLLYYKGISYKTLFVFINFTYFGY